MEVSGALLADDVDRAFADWGVAVMFRQVSSSYEPETQQVSEVHVDTPVTAIVGTASAEAAMGTAGQHLGEEREFLIRSGELPVGRPAATGRVIHEGVEYDVVEFMMVSGGLVCAVHGRRRG